MIQVPLNELKDELLRYLRLVEKEDVIVTRHGVPAGILIGLEDPEDWWEEILLRPPGFQARVAQARKSLGEGGGIPIEQLREKHGNHSIVLPYNLIPWPILPRCVTTTRRHPSRTLPRSESVRWPRPVGVLP